MMFGLEKAAKGFYNYVFIPIPLKTHKIGVVNLIGVCDEAEIDTFIQICKTIIIAWVWVAAQPYYLFVYS